MRTNKAMRLAAAVLVLTLLTTCAIGGTFAKYTAKATGTASAHVAKWGFGKDASINLDGLFATFYKSDTEGYVYYTVNSGNNENVIAPGTSREDSFDFQYAGAGKPEVAYKFSVDLTGTDPVKKLDDISTFHWTLDGTNYEKFDDLVAAVKKLSGDASGTKEYVSGQLPDAFYGTDSNASANHTIGWKWDFTGTDADTADTALGNADPLANFNLTLTVTATQID